MSTITFIIIFLVAFIFVRFLGANVVEGLAQALAEMQGQTADGGEHVGQAAIAVVEVEGALGEERRRDLEREIELRQGETRLRRRAALRTQQAEMAFEALAQDAVDMALAQAGEVILEIPGVHPGERFEGG